MKYWYIIFEVSDNRTDENTHIGVGYADTDSEFPIKKVSNIFINFFEDNHHSNDCLKNTNTHTSFKSLVSLKEISEHQYMQLGNLTIECWLIKKREKEYTRKNNNLHIPNIFKKINISNLRSWLKY